MAIVVDGQESFLCGILMPYAGVALDNLHDGELTFEHLRSLVKTVAYLQSAQVVHGDICERNVCISGAAIQLIDFGDVAPQYQDDVVAVGKLLQWCAARFAMEDSDRITKAGEELVERRNLDTALEI